MAYITLAEAKKQLRIDWTEDDTYIQVIIEGAEHAISNYLHDKYTWDATTVPKSVKLAALVLVSIYFDFYRDGDGVEEGKIAHGYLPPAVTSLLHRYRTPQMG